MPEPAHSAQRLTTLDARPPCLATIEAVVAGERTDVTCRGEFDFGAQVLQSELYAVLDRSATGVDLDLDGVGFCDCGGLNLLLDLRREALAQGKTVTVQAYSPAVGRLLDLTGARELFVTEDSAHSDAPAAEHAPVPEEWSRPVEVDHELRLEVDQLRRAMRTRPTIDVARGIVMATFGLSAEDAWTVLVTASQNTNTKLHHLAQHLMGAVHGAQVPEELRQQMAVAVAKVRETSTTPSDDVVERETAPEPQGSPPRPAV
ncbi:ANTAR domain-containing protein [Streptomyces sp. SAI-127]|uniref:ANTAR domain-containing protein n=1 Tax=Streptomyces sp. SAI-127 TaxID=2940543 RepID=UPI002475AD0C|nr:ANTAR domain-containing protein [Streptomyces sp. SAI-127]MDH6486285.1 anti-anti-sigma factor [Streptomyces sp. SAI-127]